MNDDRSSIQSENELKIKQLRRLMDNKKLDAILLQRFSSMAWVTCGADLHINTAASDGAASLLITPQETIAFTTNIEASRLENEEGLADQGWKFEVSPWYETGNNLAAFTFGKKIGSDGLAREGVDLTAEMTWLRAQLTGNEVTRFQKLGSLCTESMDEAIRAVRPGMTEFEIAGLLSQAAESRGVQATVNLVGTDERIKQYRHSIPTAKKLERYAMLILCGRKWGLVCSITRLIHFGPLPEEIAIKARKVAGIDAAMISATRPGKTLADVFAKAQGAYRDSGYPDEWKLHHQGGLAGYEPREITATPSTKQPIQPNQTFAWNPSISGAKSEDTILVGEDSNSILTEIPGWPVIEVELEHEIIRRPDILIVDA